MMRQSQGKVVRQRWRETGMFTWSGVQLVALLLLAGMSFSVQAAPTVSITSPADHSKFGAPANITITADAVADAGQTISNVKFYRGTTLIGTDTTAPYSVTWSNAFAGVFSLTAVATDNLNQATTSAAINISIATSPTVSLTEPANSAGFVTGSDITISATATPSSGQTIASVEFYAGTTLVGTATTSPFSITWSNASAGTYSITAKAIDNLGGSKVSTARTLYVGDAPTVTLTSPAAGSKFGAPASITYSATATAAPGQTISNVKFYRNGAIRSTDSTAPYSYTDNNVAAGSYNITAMVTTNFNITATTPANNITVTPSPTVTLTAPSYGDGFVTGSDITFTADATASTGQTIARVEFYAGTTLIGTATTAPYSIVWQNAPAGTYTITAKAIDNVGGSKSTGSVQINIGDPPTVSLTAPAAGAQFYTPVNITLSANAAAAPGQTISAVYFYRNGLQIGYDSTAPYSITWNSAFAGTHNITAIARSNFKLTTTSAARSITVTDAPAVSITSPAANATYGGGTPIQITANITAPAGRTISEAKFYDGTTFIGYDFTSPYSINWNPQTEGSRALTVIATDNTGTSRTSDPVNVTITMAPTVNLTAPANNTRFATGSDITLTANASAAPGRTLSQVEFYRGATLIGSATTAPYSVIWSGAAEGDYAITAKAIDDNSGAAVSDPVNVKVTSNLSPTVSLTSPAMNTNYTAPALIRLVAEAQGTSSTITQVEFYSDGILIGTATSAPYVFDWTNTLPGTYNITAKATDSNAATATSSAKTISVVLGVRQAYYIHTDHLNTPRLITSELDMPVWRWDSDPFGSTMPNEDPGNTGTNFTCNLRFPGQYLDQETMLHYNYFRDYDPETGRYIESDPVGLNGGSFSTYGYVSGNPLSYIDSKGLANGPAVGWLRPKTPRPTTSPGPSNSSSGAPETSQISCKGTWRQVGWQPIYNVVCQCSWICVPCKGSYLWSGDPHSPGLPKTRGTKSFNAAPGATHDPESGNDCICSTPGPTESCGEEGCGKK